MSLPPFLYVPKGVQLIDYLLRKNISLIQPGLVQTKDGKIFRLPTGPPDSREENEVFEKSEPNDSSITNENIFISTKPPTTPAIVTEKILTSPVTIDRGTSSANMSLPIFLAVLIIVINVFFIIWILYQFLRRNSKKSLEIKKSKSYLKLLKEKLEETTDRCGDKGLNDVTSVSDNDWIYMTSDANTDNELENDRQMTRSNITEPIKKAEEVITEKQLQMYSRNLKSLIILVTLAFHIALLSIVIASIQLYLISAYLSVDVIVNSLSHRVTCIIINPMTSFTMLSARFYLISTFILTSYIISFGCCQRTRTTGQMDSSRNLMNPDYLSKKKNDFPLQQRLVYLSLTHSVPWMISAGCSLIVIVMPLLQNSRNKAEGDSSFIVNYYPIIEKMFNCSQSSRRGHVIKPINQPSNILLIVILVMMPVIVEIILCLVYLFREVKCKKKRVSFFMLIINVFISPGLSAVSNLCCEMLDFIQNKLPLIHLMTDPVFISLILYFHFKIFREYLSILMNSNTEKNDLVEGKRFFLSLDQLNQEIFAEYPPNDSDTLNCGDIGAMCLPIQFSQTNTITSPSNLVRNYMTPSNSSPSYLINAQFQRSLVPLFVPQNQGNYYRPSPKENRIEEETEDSTEDYKVKRSQKSNDSLATAALLSATAAAMAASKKKNTNRQSPMPLEDSSNSGTTSSCYGVSTFNNHVSDSQQYNKTPTTTKRSNGILS